MLFAYNYEWNKLSETKISGIELPPPWSCSLLSVAKILSAALGVFTMGLPSPGCVPTNITLPYAIPVNITAANEVINITGNNTVSTFCRGSGNVQSSLFSWYTLGFGLSAFNPQGTILVEAGLVFYTPYSLAQSPVLEPTFFFNTYQDCLENFITACPVV